MASGYLYRDAALAQGLSIADLARHYQHRKAAMLIISDGGAARGGYDPDRVRATQTALQQLRPMSQGLAWLNPVPVNRWEGTSAAYIGRLLLPMFEANESGLYKAVNVMRGKSAGMKKHAGR